MPPTQGKFKPGPSTFNQPVTVPYETIIRLCTTLLPACISVEEGHEYPSYHLWSEIMFWACLVFTVVHEFPMTSAPQYAFYKATRPEPEGLVDRDSYITRARNQSPHEALAETSGQTETSTDIPVVHTDFKALPNLEHRFSDYNFAENFANNIPPQFYDVADQELSFGVDHPPLIGINAGESVDDTFLSDSTNKESVTWHTPDSVAFEHLLNPAGNDQPDQILPRIIVENKPFIDLKDVDLFYEQREDYSKEEDRQRRATFMIEKHLTQLRQQSLMLFSEYRENDLGQVHGIIAYGWYWKAWVLRRELDKDGLPIAAVVDPIACSAFNKDFTRFHLKLAMVWRAAARAGSSGQ
ncbi:hypothetical protein D9758_018085 [Tetrapyrgos nigripes]|uniref:Uncharacterized protein n=1 Tax=Tetrapyrgos nigripes TaxID=182062 RepID=A0A8H5BBV8_9AGAR|nr:hypothetical protein D9758_018085 [Tetrapyrgos nigripes]